MPYIPHTDEDLKRMQKRLGPSYMDSLKEIIPAELRLNSPLDIPGGLSEQGSLGLLTRLAGKNTDTTSAISFLGAGAYNHYTPALVPYLVARSEFITSYTPYQPEISQGTLQAIFEYQTLICQLTGMDVSNASLYDGASATAEAVLMARRINGDGKIILSSALHPEYLQTVRTYLSAIDCDIVELPISEETGETDPSALKEILADENEKVSCVVTASPNFFGVVEDTRAFSKAAHLRDALSIAVTTEPLSLALLRPPGELDADIAVGEAQSFGSSVNFGGPYLGFMATKDKFVRKMPGRIVGEAKDADGRRSFCLTLSTREQHIRREAATSNICTNEGLSALTAAIYMASLGKEGLKELATLNLAKAEYLKGELKGTGYMECAFTSPTFNEFTVKLTDGRKAAPLLKSLRDEGIFGGVELKRFYPEMDDAILIAVTEMNSKVDIDLFVEKLGGLK